LRIGVRRRNAKRRFQPIDGRRKEIPASHDTIPQQPPLSDSVCCVSGGNQNRDAGWACRCSCSRSIAEGFSAVASAARCTAERWRLPCLQTLSRETSKRLAITSMPTPATRARSISRRCGEVQHEHLPPIPLAITVLPDEPQFYVAEHSTSGAALPEGWSARVHRLPPCFPTTRATLRYAAKSGLTVRNLAMSSSEWAARGAVRGAPGSSARRPEPAPRRREGLGGMTSQSGAKAQDGSSGNLGGPVHAHVRAYRQFGSPVEQWPGPGSPLRPYRERKLRNTKRGGSRGPRKRSK
jgi:hypothetical protein